MLETTAPPEGFPRVEILDANSGLERGRGLLDAIVGQELQAVVVRGAFSRELTERALSVLERGELEVHGSGTHEGAAVRIYGQPLQWAEAGLGTYLRSAEAFRGGCRALFGNLDYEAHLRALLGALAHPTPVELASSTDGRPYASSTIRSITRGGRIPPHFEVHQLAFPSYSDLAPRIDGSAVLSFYVTLQHAEAGGALVVHTMTLADFDRSDLGRLGRDHLEPALAAFERSEIPTEPGDLLVFDSGRFAHEITAVDGGRPRWTIGGVLAPSRAHDRVLFWH